MNSAIRPFQHIRYEYEQRHIYYLPPKLMARLEAPKPAYLLGTRGTGKTTLLKALEWNERLTNSSLKRQVGEDPLSGRYIGCYLKLPLYMLAKLEERLPSIYPGAIDVLLALYLDLIILQPLCVALAELAARGILNFSPENESESVRRVTELFPFLERHHTTPPVTLRNLQSRLRKAQRELEAAVLYDREIENSLLEAVTGIGELGRAVSEEFGSLCNSNEDRNPWHFKACLDEAESLKMMGRKILNTLVRVSKVPLIYVAAFVGPPDVLIETLNHSLTLAEDDRSLVRLDQLSNKDFRLLAEGVATARIQEATDNAENKINLKAILGKLNIDGLASSILKESVNPLSKEILGQSASRKGSAVIAAFLQSELAKEEPTDLEFSWQRRRHDSAFKRKVKVAAYLTLCRRIGTEPRYSSAEMVIEMSDHCIRDFLRFLNELFIESDAKPENFCNTLINVRAQDVAIKRASKAKVDCLNESGVHEPMPTQRIIDGLAHITATLQSTGKHNSNLRSPERGIFVVDVHRLPKEDAIWLSTIISEAVEAGFLILKKRDSQTWSFRVHKSLAAFYGFSYRGAYYPVMLHGSDLIKLARSDESVAFNEVVRQLSRKHVGIATEDTPLFATTPHDD